MTTMPYEPTIPAPGRRRPASASAATGAAWWLSGIVVVTVMGFRGPLAQHGADLAHAAHGSFALGWSLLLIVQAALADAHRRKAHRLFAIAGVIFAAGLVTTSLPMLHSIAGAAVRIAPFQPIGYQLLAMDVLLMALFVTLVAVAIAFVRKPVVHSRAMAATGVLALPAGLGRAYMPWFGVDAIGGSNLALATGALLLLALIIRDRRSSVREPVYPATLAAIAAVLLLFPVIARTAWFDHAARLFAAA